jgi:hypothetical protein
LRQFIALIVGIDFLSLMKPVYKDGFNDQRKYSVAVTSIIWTSLTEGNVPLSLVYGDFRYADSAGGVSSIFSNYNRAGSDNKLLWI